MSQTYKACSAVIGTILGRLKGCGLSGRYVSLRTGCEVSKMCRFWLFSVSCLWFEMWALGYLFPGTVSVCCSFFPNITVRCSYTSVNVTPNKPAVVKVAIGIVFCYSNRKVTKSSYQEVRFCCDRLNHVVFGRMFMTETLYWKIMWTVWVEGSPSTIWAVRPGHGISKRNSISNCTIDSSCGIPAKRILLLLVIAMIWLKKILTEESSNVCC